MATNEIIDSEFGPVQIHRVKGRSSVLLKITPAGAIRITMPPYAPLFMAKRLLESSRVSVRGMLEQHSKTLYADGMQIGKSHTLTVVGGEQFSVRRHDRVLTVYMPEDAAITDANIQAEIRKSIIPLLRKEAKHYLPKRLAYLASNYGFSYASVRFSHASSRWGSCSSSGTISLNIALMKLPFELIDYVLLHELCHTQQMNHSTKFWKLVESVDAEYLLHRKILKSHSPAI